MNVEEYKHYLTYDSIVRRSNLNELINLVRNLIGNNIEELRKCYELDHNLNNLENLLQIIKEELPSLKEQILKLTYKDEITLQNIKDLLNRNTKKIEHFGNKFDLIYKRVYRLLNGVYNYSLADNSCIIKHIMKYYILKIKFNKNDK